MLFRSLSSRFNFFAKWPDNNVACRKNSTTPSTQSIESILRLALNWEQVNGIVINPFGKYIRMTKKIIELLINGYEHYENERKSKDDENN